MTDELRARFITVDGYLIPKTMIADRTLDGVVLLDGRTFHHPREVF
jgi:hypothetical protein